MAGVQPERPGTAEKNTGEGMNLVMKKEYGFGLSLCVFVFCSVLNLFPVLAEQIKPEKDSPVKVAVETEKITAGSELAGRNPFLFPQEEAVKERREVLSSLSLSAIFISPASNSYAIIEGRILKAGDTFQGKKITGINSGEVELSDINGSYVIYMDQK